MSFDIDVDVKASTNKQNYGVRLSVVTISNSADFDRISPHPSGFVLPASDGSVPPFDPETGLVSVEADMVASMGFNKVDLLTNTFYDKFDSKDEVLAALDSVESFDWGKMQDKSFVEQLPHLSNHFALIRQVQPKSIEDLADCLALIRPGKVDLLQDYLKDKARTRPRLYIRPSNGGIYFKKSHAIAYALMIVVGSSKRSLLDEILS